MERARASASAASWSSFLVRFTNFLVGGLRLSGGRLDFRVGRFDLSADDGRKLVFFMGGDFFGADFLAADGRLAADGLLAADGRLAAEGRLSAEGRLAAEARLGADFFAVEGRFSFPLKLDGDLVAYFLPVFFLRTGFFAGLFFFTTILTP